MTTAPRGTSPVATAMAVLRCFSPEHPVLGVVEIAEEIGLHKSSVSRMMTTLEAEDLVEQDPLSKKYRLGLGLLSVAGSLLANLDVRRAALPVLTELTAATGETSSLVLWDRFAAVIVEQVPSANPIKHVTELGSRYSRVEDASVRVRLATLSDTERDEFFDAAPQSRAAYRRLAANDRDGVAVNNGDTTPDEVGVAAAVRDHRGRLIAAILLAVPAYRVDDDRLAQLCAACRAAADDLTRALGGTPEQRTA
ncbi:IclR family transcriptional regulator [Flexivirga oryzae]|uniref:DNA-binding IclR family transcriptional regulator n=1 Tax=Flexivirga oryzae TaxID=1794944 RepID=A0A839NB15_9MICO|nr:IclR family transcriptional regulator [Flexivirga oryzae]MBB2893174.1 DNA-binding IclR family transcriptional regulator [Flexivirga oryzae]